MNQPSLIQPSCTGFSEDPPGILIDSVLAGGTLCLTARELREDGKEVELSHRHVSSRAMLFAWYAHSAQVAAVAKGIGKSHSRRTATDAVLCSRTKR